MLYQVRSLFDAGYIGLLTAFSISINEPLVDPSVLRDLRDHRSLDDGIAAAHGMMGGS